MIKKDFKDYIPILGIYFYTKKYVNAERTFGYFQAEEMFLYHFSAIITVMIIYVYFKYQWI